MGDIRSFLAIAIDNPIIERLCGVQQRLRQAHADVAWVKPAGLHITLKFLGNIAEENVASIGEALATIGARYQAFPLRVANTGGFPNLRQPRVLWAGISEGSAELCHLVKIIDDALCPAGFAREVRPFRAHLTIGRLRSPVNLCALTDEMTAFSQQDFGAMTARDILLMRSELSPQGANHTVLRQVPFTGEESL